MVGTPKKPTNQKGKSIYFNIDDPGELRLYEYAKGIKNFSGYIKAILYAELIKNNGQAPNPYSYAAIMQSALATQQDTISMNAYRSLEQGEVAASLEEPSIPSPEKVTNNNKGESLKTDGEPSHDEDPLNNEESQYENEDDLEVTDAPEIEEDSKVSRPKVKNISAFMA